MPDSNIRRKWLPARRIWAGGSKSNAGWRLSLARWLAGRFSSLPVMPYRRRGNPRRRSFSEEILWLVVRLSDWASNGAEISSRVLSGCERLAASKNYSPAEALERVKADASARAVRDVLVARGQELRVFHLWFFRGAQYRAEVERVTQAHGEALADLHAVKPS